MYKAVKIIVFVVFLFAVFFLFSNEIEDFLNEKITFSYEPVPISDDLILEEVNRERALVGASALVVEESLVLVAQKKLEDMFSNDYFEHTSPDGIEVNHLADDVGYEFILIGENLLQGRFEDEKDVVQAWMDSPGHRKNILNEKYMETGVASAYGDFLGVELLMSVQVFAVPFSACPDVDRSLRASIEEKEEIIDQLRSKIEGEENIPEYNGLVDQYNEVVSRITDLIAEYNRQIEIQEDCFSHFR